MQLRSMFQTAVVVGTSAAILYWLFALITDQSALLAPRTYMIVGVFAGLGSFIGSYLLQSVRGNKNN